jgi:transcriptional regulator with XRE-family HTH domain
MAETATVVRAGSCIGGSPPGRWRKWSFLCFVTAAAAMTPFGVKIRNWRQRKNRTLHQQAEALSVSAAYLSALETGARGRPSAVLVDQICVWLGLIWDDAEDLKRLAALSHPKPTVNARGHSAEAIYMVNFLAQNIDRLSAADCRAVTDVIVTCLQHDGDEESSQP